ncbi:MAG: Ig-like domain-containing protein, partial [Moraxella sp.]|nr:Ig-like domain-containing protein [Moraxella sp.]
DGTPDSTTIKGTAEAGSTIKVRDPDNSNPDTNVIGTAVVNPDGTFEVVISPALKNGVEYPVTATDIAGNESPKTPVVGDTVALAPTSVTIGTDGDAWVNAAEKGVDGKTDVKIGLPTDAKAGDTLTVNGETITLTDAQITAKEAIVKVDVPADGETLNIVATITDNKGNTSLPTEGTAVVDTKAPAAPVATAATNGDGTVS